MASDPLGTSTTDPLRRDALTDRAGQLRRWLDRHAAFLADRSRITEQVRGYQKYEGKMGAA
ncbi:hypothetical protein [Streptomyces sp. NBC_01264]|uniref:hypothetical protein n=1 Tax=Streptomyces sp. NBC_01264 TaxID=2903804 RepID=UPI0022517155|nr:hypothetical protein [Streptomyces sp. NBC_01264]MCX4776058.1 hypothetical protein [Streptomyces sp. NBC_01264]